MSSLFDIIIFIVLSIISDVHTHVCMYIFVCVLVCVYVHMCMLMFVLCMHACARVNLGMDYNDVVHMYVQYSLYVLYLIFFVCA